MNLIAHQPNAFKAIVCLAGFMFAGTSAQAAQLFCSGRYLGIVKFTIEGTVNSSNQVVGFVHIEVKGGGVNEVADLAPQSSDIRPGQRIRLEGENEKGSGAIDTTYNSGSGKYVGRLHAVSNFVRTVNVNVTCDLQRSLTGDPSIDDPGIEDENSGTDAADYDYDNTEAFQ